MKDKLDELHYIYKMIGNYGFCTVQELLDKYNGQKEVIDKAIEYVKRNIYSYYDSKGEKYIEETVFERNVNPKELLDILKEVSK